MLALLIVGACALYALIGALVGGVAYASARKRSKRGIGDPEMAGMLGGIFWPIALFIAFGKIVANHVELSPAERAEAKAEMQRRARARHIEQLEIEAGYRCEHGQPKDGTCLSYPCRRYARWD